MQTCPADSEQTGSPSALRAMRESSIMRSVNRGMREVSGVFALPNPIAFFCECDNPTCYSVVSISAGAFDEAVENDSGWLLVEGHQPSASSRVRPTRADTGDRSRTELLDIA